MYISYIFFGFQFFLVYLRKKKKENHEAHYLLVLPTNSHKTQHIDKTMQLPGETSSRRAPTAQG